jgi:hypothetical protein
MLNLIMPHPLLIDHPLRQTPSHSFRYLLLITVVLSYVFSSLSPYSLHWPDVHSDLPRVLLSDVLSVSALVDALNNPSVGNATETTVLGPFFAEDA